MNLFETIRRSAPIAFTSLTRLHVLAIPIRTFQSDFLAAQISVIPALGNLNVEIQNDNVSSNRHPGSFLRWIPGRAAIARRKFPGPGRSKNRRAHRIRGANVADIPSDRGNQFAPMPATVRRP